MRVPHASRQPAREGGELDNAFAQSSGDLILTLDADHVVQPAMRGRTIGYFEDPRVAAFFCGTGVVLRRAAAARHGAIDAAASHPLTTRRVKTVDGERASR